MGILRKITITALAVPVALVGAFWINNTLSDHRIYSEALREYKGIQLGESQLETRYKLGAPPYVMAEGDPKDDWEAFYSIYDTNPKTTDTVNRMPEGKAVEDFVMWTYTGAGQDRVDVFYDAKTRRVHKVECFTNSSGSTFGFCEPLYGFYGDQEPALVEAFGEPTSSSIEPKSSVKTMRWEQLGMQIRLQRQKAYMVTRWEPQGASFWRYWWHREF